MFGVAKYQPCSGSVVMALAVGEDRKLFLEAARVFTQEGFNTMLKNMQQDFLTRYKITPFISQDTMRRGFHLLRLKKHEQTIWKMLVTFSGPFTIGIPADSGTDLIHTPPESPLGSYCAFALFNLQNNTAEVHTLVTANPKYV